ncbi:tetratricopeptide repeat protein [Allocoleopsis sp.]|uniref:tetratricopeptide repeat protein n=1 Tax=Allocoleopsis sp. TaxID=3088169 RepID=UPI002FD681F6
MMRSEYSPLRSNSRWSRLLTCFVLFGLAGVLPLVPVDGMVPAASAQAVPAAVRRAQSLLNQGLVNQAIAAFQQALRSNPNSVEAKLGLAQAYQKAGKDAEAWAAFQRVLEQDPNNKSALRAVGVLGGYRPEWQLPGIQALNTLLSQNPNDLEARAQRALLLGYQGRYSESFADYQPVLASNPSPTPSSVLPKSIPTVAIISKRWNFLGVTKPPGKRFPTMGYPPMRPPCGKRAVLANRFKF